MPVVFGRRALGRGALAAGVAGMLPAFGAKAAQTTLEDVNRMTEASFVQAFGNFYESAPWVAKAAYAKRPFATVAALHQAMADAFAAAPRDQQLKFFRDRPDIAGLEGLE